MKNIFRIFVIIATVLAISLLSVINVLASPAPSGGVIPNPPQGLINYDFAFVPVVGGYSTPICFPVPEEGKRNLHIRYWAVPAERWVVIDTTITDGYVCGTAITPSIYALQGPRFLGVLPPKPT